jgi:hypothetical protein
MQPVGAVALASASMYKLSRLESSGRPAATKGFFSSSGRQGFVTDNVASLRTTSLSRGQLPAGAACPLSRMAQRRPKETATDALLRCTKCGDVQGSLEAISAGADVNYRDSVRAPSNLSPPSLLSPQFRRRARRRWYGRPTTARRRPLHLGKGCPERPTPPCGAGGGPTRRRPRRSQRRRHPGADDTPLPHFTVVTRHETTSTHLEGKIPSPPSVLFLQSTITAQMRSR